MDFSSYFFRIYFIPHLNEINKIPRVMCTFEGSGAESVRELFSEQAHGSGPKWSRPQTLFFKPFAPDPSLSWRNSKKVGWRIGEGRRPRCTCVNNTRMGVIEPDWIVHSLDWMQVVFCGNPESGCTNLKDIHTEGGRTPSRP